MPKKKNETAEVESGTKAGAKSQQKQITKKKVSKEFAANIIRDSETARERGRNGGKKSVEVAKKKREARENEQKGREAARAVLCSMTKSPTVKSNLEELGVDPEDYDNVTSLCGRLLAMGLGGDLDAIKLLLQLAGYDPEEKRKERESLSSDARKNKETEAKLNALGGSVENAQVAVNINDDEGNNDVVIYLPEIRKEEDCQLPPEDEEND